MTFSLLVPASQNKWYTRETVMWDVWETNFMPHVILYIFKDVLLQGDYINIGPNAQSGSLSGQAKKCFITMIDPPPAPPIFYILLQSRMATVYSFLQLFGISCCPLHSTVLYGSLMYYILDCLIFFRKKCTIVYIYYIVEYFEPSTIFYIWKGTCIDIRIGKWAMLASMK